MGDDLAHPQKFLLRRRDIVAGLWVSGCLVNQIKEVRNSLQRIIDLVRDGSCQPADGSKLLTLDESSFRALLLIDI
jgi:hypothetical protein